MDLNTITLEMIPIIIELKNQLGSAINAWNATRGGGAKKWSPSNRKAVCADGKMRSLFKCSSSPGKLFVRRITKTASSPKSTVKYVPFVPAPSASAKKPKKVAKKKTTTKKGAKKATKK